MTHPSKHQAIILAPQREKSVLLGNRWIFSGAIASYPKVEAGTVVPVLDHQGKLLGHGYVQPKGSIAVRMLSFGGESWEQTLWQSLENAKALRAQLFQDGRTTAYRLINGEGDEIPGLIVDRYHDGFVVQSGTKGMDLLMPRILEWLITSFQPRFIYEKSKANSRKEELLTDSIGLRYGTLPPEVHILENDLTFKIDIEKGQKTGFFLDQRPMRQLVEQMAKGKHLLNTFCYTGGFSVYAARGQAASVDSVDVSEQAVAMVQWHMQKNQLKETGKALKADAFSFLREAPFPYDFVILDPPAFVKHKKDIQAGLSGYKECNRVAMSRIKPRSFLLTCSCSSHVDQDMFQKVAFQAALDAKRSVKVIDRHHYASDHPVHLAHPLGDYLKSLLLYVE